MIGIVGGSGLYALEGLEGVSEKVVDTPFGKPSDAFIVGKLRGRDVCFLPRHGRGHRIMPSEINHRANIFGFKLLGAKQVLSVSAVGSLREDLRPRDVVLPDQYYDRTKQSTGHTFFGDGIVAHVSFAEPGCKALRPLMAEVIAGCVTTLKRDVRVQAHGTYVCMEGPAFSTKAESGVYRSLGFDVIGMTSLPEAKLCKEAEICYQAMAMVTDYDCWHETEEPVTVQMVIGHLNANTELAKVVLQALIPRLPDVPDCGCGGMLEHALLTPPEAWSPEVVARLRPLVGRYLER
ncbi:MAG: S-methyl-5'-thioadenosine phosphorylase [Verrucomicrobia bacterium]|nr:S-methyl-5'-thioadenosine phosphorylase [Verrucomicrobiota bacterium]